VQRRRDAEAAAKLMRGAVCSCAISGFPRFRGYAVNVAKLFLDFSVTKLKNVNRFS
jgi:hypothetical protein